MGYRLLLVHTIVIVIMCYNWMPGSTAFINCDISVCDFDLLMPKISYTVVEPTC